MGEMFRLDVGVVQFGVAGGDFDAVDGEFVNIGEIGIVLVFAGQGDDDRGDVRDETRDRSVCARSAFRRPATELFRRGYNLPDNLRFLAGSTVDQLASGMLTMKLAGH